MIKPYFQLSAYDENQSLLRQTAKEPARSFVQQFLFWHYKLSIISLSSTPIDIKDIDGNTLNVSQGDTTAYMFLSQAPGRGGRALEMLIGDISSDRQASSSTNNGIVIGTGTDAVAPDDFKLQTQILDGSGSGELEHFPCAGGPLEIVSNIAAFELERLFRNTSGDAITINEVGIYCVGFPVYIGTATARRLKHYCILRDRVSPGFSVADGEYLKVAYTLSVSA